MPTPPDMSNQIDRYIAEKLKRNPEYLRYLQGLLNQMKDNDQAEVVLEEASPDDRSAPPRPPTSHHHLSDDQVRVDRRALSNLSSIYKEDYVPTQRLQPPRLPALDTTKLERIVEAAVPMERRDPIMHPRHGDDSYLLRLASFLPAHYWVYVAVTKDRLSRLLQPYLPQIRSPPH